MTCFMLILVLKEKKKVKGCVVRKSSSSSVVVVVISSNNRIRVRNATSLFYRARIEEKPLHPVSLAANSKESSAAEVFNSCKRSLPP